MRRLADGFSWLFTLLARQRLHIAPARSRAHPGAQRSWHAGGDGCPACANPHDHPAAAAIGDHAQQPSPTRGVTVESRVGASPSPRSTLPATWTAAPDQPQFWTATSGADSTAIATLPPVRGFASPTPSPTATRFQPTVSVRRDLLLEEIAPPTAQPLSLRMSDASAFAYEVQPGQPFAIGDIRLSGGVRLFALNPTDSSSYVYTDLKGILRFTALGAAQAAELIDSPFHAGYSMGIDSIEGNKHRVVEVDWSADGRMFSFRIDPPAGLDNSGGGGMVLGARIASRARSYLTGHPRLRARRLSSLQLR